MKNTILSLAPSYKSCVCKGKIVILPCESTLNMRGPHKSLISFSFF
jgi:hypothetical protein